MSKTKYEHRDWLKIPNLITSIKFITVPLMVYFAVQKSFIIFFIFLALNWFIDFIDGAIASMLNQRTLLGYYLDTYTDLFFDFSIAISLFFIYPLLLLRYKLILILIASGLFIFQIFSFIKFRKFYLLHLWSSKMAVNILLIFFVTNLTQPDYIFMDITMFLLVLYIIESFIIAITSKKVNFEILTVFDSNGKKMRTLSENLKLLPNKITFSRFIFLPFLFYFAYKNNFLWFSIFFYMAFISDQLDGIVARKLKQCSTYGSKMDATADDIYNISGVFFLYFMRKQMLQTLIYFIIPLLLFFLIDKIINGVKFKSRLSLHLYSGKIYQRYYYITFPLLLYTQNLIFFYVLFFLGACTSIERIWLYLKYKSPKKNIRSLIPLKYNLFYHIMKYWP